MVKTAVYWVHCRNGHTTVYYHYVALPAGDWKYWKCNRVTKGKCGAKVEAVYSNEMERNKW